MLADTRAVSRFRSPCGTGFSEERADMVKRMINVSDKREGNETYIEALGAATERIIRNAIYEACKDD